MKIGLIAHYGEDFYKSRVDFLEYLQEQGNETFSFVPEDDYKNKIDQLNQKVFYYQYSRSWRFIFSLFSTYKLFVSVLKKEKPDVLFTYKFFPNIVGILAGRKANIPKVVATIAGIGFLEKRQESILIKYVFKYYMNILNKADYVVTQNAEDLELLKSNLKKPKLILTHGSGVNSQKMTTSHANDEHFISQNNLDSKKKYITFCSRIVKEKGILELVEAYNQTELDYELIIAGWFDEKGLEEDVLNKIKDNPKIHYLGYQKNVSNLLSISEVIILPSYYPEGVPRSLIEALAWSKIIITTNHKGCKETCIDGENGYLVEPRSVTSLVEVLQKLNKLDNESLNNFRNKSRKLFDEKFDREVVYNTIWNAVK